MPFWAALPTRKALPARRSWALPAAVLQLGVNGVWRADVLLPAALPQAADPGSGASCFSPALEELSSRPVEGLLL